MAKKLHKKRKTRNPKKHTSNQNQHKEVAAFDITAELQVVQENSCDKISDLPHDVLRKIISLLPFESAAETRLLSATWREVWSITSVQRGSMNGMATAIPSFLDSVDWVKPLAHPWKPQYHSEEGSILEASTGANSKLQLDCSKEESNSSGKFYLELEVSTQKLKCQVCPSSFGVRFLCLKSVNNLCSEAVSSVLPNLHFLERLEIRECKGMFGMSVNAGWKLKHLTIVDCYQLRSISILGHALEFLCYKGRFPEIFIVGLSHLKDVMLDFREGPSYAEFKCLSSHSLLMLFLKDAEHITLCQWTFQVMIRPRLYSQDPDAQFKHLRELWWISNAMEEENINSLISFLEVCPKIEKIYITIDPTCYNLPSKSDCHWTRKTPNNKLKRLENLKLVKMEGAKSEEDELLLANCIFKIATKKPIVIATARNSSYTRRLVKIGPNRRKFVEEVDAEFTNSKHRHVCIN